MHVSVAYVVVYGISGVTIGNFEIWFMWNSDASRVLTHPIGSGTSSGTSVLGLEFGLGSDSRNSSKGEGQLEKPKD